MNFFSSIFGSGQPSLQVSISAPSVPNNPVANSKGSIKGRSVEVVKKGDEEKIDQERSFVRIAVIVGLIALGILIFFTFYHFFAFVGAGILCYKAYEWYNSSSSEPPSVINSPIVAALSASNPPPIYATINQEQPSSPEGEYRPLKYRDGSL